MSKLIFEFEIEGTKIAVENLGDVKDAVKLVNKALLSTKEGSAEQKRLIKILGQLKSAQATVTNEVKRAKAAYEETNKFAKGSYKQLNAELVRLKDSLKSLSAEDADGILGESMRTRIAEINRQLSAFDKSISRNAANTKFAAGSYRELNARLVASRKRYKELSEEEREGKVGQQMLKDIQKLDTRLKKLDGSMGNYQRNVGNYASALKGLGKVVGGAFLLGGATEIVQRLGEFVKESIGVFADFTRQVSFIGAVSGATKSELDALEETARRLGGTTEFTASQVAKLEIEYAKLGFKPAEILEATAATLDLATVSQSELGETAAVVGATIRAFNLDTEETGRVANVAALAFSNSALDLSKFSTAMAIVAPVAASAGKSIEETTGLMGVLADAGVDASTVGTGLRNVFLDLAVEGLTLEEALDQISNATDSNVKAVELFGKRGATVGTILAANRDRVDELTGALGSNQKFAKDAAETIRGDLKGSFDNLTSATENLQLTLVGGFEGALQAGTDFLTNVVRGLSSGLDFLFDAFAPVFDALGELIGLFFDGEAAGSVFDAVVNFLAGTIRVVANSLTGTIKGISFFIKGIRNAAAAVPFFTKVNDALRKGLLFLIGAIGKFPAVVNGLVEVLLNGQRRVANFAKRALLTAQILGKDIESLISDSAKAEAEALRKQRDNLKEQGESIADAFNRGFKDGIVKGESPVSEVVNEKEVSEVKKDAETKGREIGDVLATGTLAGLRARKAEINEQLENALIGSDKFKRLEKELQGINKQIDKATGKKSKEAKKDADEIKTIYEQLSAKEKQLKKDILDASLAGKDYSKQQEELRQVSEKLRKAQEAVSISTKDTDEAMDAAQGSVKLLSEVVSDLKDELEKASPENVEDIAAQLKKAEDELAKAQERINQLLGKSDDDRIERELKNSEDAIKRRLALEIQALREKGLDTKDFEEQRKLLELQAERDIQTEKTKIYKDGTLERLEAEQEAADKEAEISKFRLDNLTKEQRQKLDIFTQATNEIANGINSVIANVNSKNSTIAQNQIRDLEAYYASEIELAEGNESRQEELRQELAERREEIERKEFERQKKVQLAAANISYFTGLINILSAPTTLPDPFGAIFKGLRVGVLTATHATNIAAIKAQEFAERGALLEGDGLDQIRSSYNVDGINYQPLTLGTQKGLSHKDGGNHTLVGNTYLEYEKDEFVDVDENGNIVIINKKSAKKFKGVLNANKGRRFTGKLNMLSNINNFAGYGKQFAETGAIIPSSTSVASAITGTSGGSQMNVVKMDAEQILAFSQTVGQYVKQGTIDGHKEAQSEQDLQKFREQRLQKRLEI